MTTLAITPDDPRSPDVRALLTRHLELMHEQSPPEDVHALDVDALTAPHVTFVSARDGAGGELLGVGAITEISPGHGEIKSMHTAAAARRRGVAGALLDHLLALADARGYARVSLETGTEDGFAAARALYARAGFAECPPFGSYRESPSSVFLTRESRPA
ncbi:GCN5 family N-acetyltransferase [Cellulomonas hominis]|uniref:GCN5 family N-acetyltransferase n=1 Tax=Cellulomonas hominis TaxID=156981 RepID=A0A511FBY9_9CELL|nr:GNAT family N-acetyltransferase [Cellulomonas hominis]MBB5472682.1 putative acetyltransferase [Cellulomonas hominis]NKY06709.1 GNAT family N-acetyltransferase [Cellulomonas hominis]GEL46745.1 GCN5 family N-acetyltransferase [Cellulomonas hominis]